MRLAVIAPGFHAGVGDPFAPYWADCVAGLATRFDVTVIPLRLPAAGAPFRLYGAEVVPLGHGHVPLRRSPALWRDAVRAVRASHDRAPFDLVYALHGNEAGFVGALAARVVDRSGDVQRETFVSHYQPTGALTMVGPAPAPVVAEAPSDSAGPP